MRPVIKFIFISMIAVHCTCISYTVASRSGTLRLLVSDYPTLAVRNEWQRFGAYYEIDELFAEAPYRQTVDPLFTGQTYSSARSTMVISQRIRILTRKGMAYGTVPIHTFQGKIFDFVPRAWDEKGNPLPLDIPHLKAEFEKTGTVIFPTVTPGSLLEIYMVISSSKPLTSFEYRFRRPIPVYKARFSFSYPNVFQYAFKEYGPPGPGQPSPPDADKGVTRRSWTKENILPGRILGEDGPPDSVENRVALSMRSGFDKQVYSRWPEVAGMLQRHLFGQDRYAFDARAKTIADSLVKGLPAPYPKADKILAWVQENISLVLDDSRTFDPEDALLRRKANPWEKAWICRTMLQESNLTSDIVLTRSREYGGFDESFVSPLFLQVPIVTVEIGKKEYGCYPYLRGAAAGEYPEDLFSLKGLSLQRKAVVPLPLPLAYTSRFDLDYSLACIGDTLSNSLELTYRGPVACKLRHDLLSSQTTDIKNRFQQRLSSMDPANILSTCRIRNLEDRGAPLTVIVSFYNRNQIVRRKGTERVGLSHLFYPFYRDIDSAGISPFSLYNPIALQETVVFKKPAGKNVSLVLDCPPLENDMVSIQCITSESADYCKCIRTVALAPFKTPRTFVSASTRTLQAINRIKGSYLLIQ